MTRVRNQKAAEYVASEGQIIQPPATVADEVESESNTCSIYS
jgi:hypothetical protein